MPMMDDTSLSLILFATATLAGFVDAIAGGGGLLTIPALLWAGVSPAQALATNKAQACFGSGSASWRFVTAGQTRPMAYWPAIAACGAGAALGAAGVYQLDQTLLRTVVPVLLLGAAAFFVLAPASANPRPRLGENGYLAVVLGIGFYDGFFGPGTGSFLVLSLVTLLGMELKAATARTKVLNFSSNIASLGVFLFSDQIIWRIGLVMAVGQALGAWLGSHLVITKGAAIVRPVLVIISLVLTARVIATSDSGLWHDLIK